MSKNIDKKVAELMSRFGGPHVYSKNKYIESFCLFISRWYYKLTKGLYFDLKFLLQKIFRGYSDLDKWNAAWFISRKAVTILKAWRECELHSTSIIRHREDRFGNIIELKEEEIYRDDMIPAAFTVEEWEKIIDEIIYAFEFVLHDDIFVEEFSEDKYKENYKRHKRGMKLLSIYFFSLWD